MAELLEKIGSGLLKILGMFKNPELIKPIDEGIDVEECPEDHVRDVEMNQVPQTLGELLENIDITFNNYKLKSHSASWLHARDRKGLKKLGAHVPNPWLFRTFKDHETIKVDVSKGMPAIMFISVPNDREEKETCNVKYAYAIKHKKLPWYLEKVSGTPYQFGMAFHHGKLMWMNAWIVVAKDGTLTICKERRNIPVRIVKNGRVKGEYAKHVYDTSEFVKGYDEEGKDGMAIVKEGFFNAFEWWIKRADRWSVAVKKDNDLITFAVDKSLTKKYFADRNVTVLTPKGQKKKIIHFVKQHERNYSGKITVVKEHLRGINSFEWNGYKCTVSAPEFGMTISNSFTSGAEEIDGTEKMVTLDRLAEVLVRTEEMRAMR